MQPPLQKSEDLDFTFYYGTKEKPCVNPPSIGSSAAPSVKRIPRRWKKIPEKFGKFGKEGLQFCLEIW